MGGITRLNQLPDGSGILSSDDIFLMMDDPSGSAITKKVSLAALSSIISQDSITPNVQTINSASGTINTDVSLYNVFNINLASSGTLASPSNSSDGQRSLWRVKRTDGQVLTLHNNFRIINSGTIDNSTHTTTFIDGIYDSNANRWDSIIHNNLPAIAPTAPSGLSGSPGNGLVNLSWSAPSYNGGSSITDYIIQYSANSGVSWNTFNDGIGTSLSGTVTGLINNTSYIFRVAAQNDIDIGPYSTQSSGIVPLLNTSLLLHFDGANDSTVFTDSSVNSLSVSGVDGAKISTDQNKFGGSSAYFNNNHLEITDNNGSPVEELSFGSGQFTIDFWVYVTGGSSYKNLLELGTVNSYPADRLSIHIYPNGKLTLENTGAGNLPSDPSAFPLNEWVHVAVTRDSSNILRLFVNGSVVASDTISQSFVANIVRVGKQWDGAHFIGYMDELRIIKGEASYTDTFTPPASAYT